MNWITGIALFGALALWLFHGPFIPKHPNTTQYDSSPTFVDIIGMQNGTAYALNVDHVMYIRDGVSERVSGISGVVSITKAGPNTAYAYSINEAWVIKDGVATKIRTKHAKITSGSLE